MTMGDALRVGIAGAGIGVQYARFFQRLDEVDVVALCASSPRRAVPAAEALGIPRVHLDYRDLLGEDLDIVVVATPNHLHYDMTHAALQAGAHVVCDKPLALDAAEARAMCAAADSAGLRHCVPFWWRCLPASMRAIELVGSGSLGPVRFVDARYLNRGWGDVEGPMRWQFQRAKAGSGALANIGSHVIALVQAIAGPIVAVAAHAAISVSERRWENGEPARPDVEDTIAFVGTLAGGAPVSFLASSVAHWPGSLLDVTVHCERGSVNVRARPEEPSTSLLVVHAGETHLRSEPTGADAHVSGRDAAYAHLVSEFVAAIREDRPAAPGFDEGVSVQETMDAVISSARVGGWVVVERAAALA